MEFPLLERLKVANPWLFGGPAVAEARHTALPDEFIPRRQIREESLLTPDRAHLVVGPRQAGKSTLVWSVLRRLRRPLYLNMEEHAFRRLCDSAAGFVGQVAELGPPPEALFLDEAQWLDDAGIFVKGLVDLKVGYPIIVTGSASFHLRDRMRESLAGRATRNLLLPFSLAEVAPEQPPGGEAGLRLVRERLLRRQLLQGGYPRAWLAGEPAAVLGDILEAFVLRDASDLFRVERLDAYRVVLELCARQVGNLVKVAEFASQSGVSWTTVARFLAMMEEAHVLRLVPAFAGGKRREVTSMRKVYFLDNGLRNAVTGQLGHAPGGLELGALHENWVFSELVKNLPWSWPIRYWRSLSGAEVDFVVAAAGRLLAVEVKAKQLHRPSLSRSAHSFISAYQPDEFWLLNRGFRDTSRVAGTVVRWADFTDLPDLLASWL